MDDTLRHRHPADFDPPMPTETELVTALARSEAQAAAGQVVSGDEVLQEIDESIARMDAKRRLSGLPPRTASRR